MAATIEDVNRWIVTAKKQGAKYIISVCDTWDYDDYPVYVMPKDDLNEIKKKYSGVDMQRINEIIELKEDGSVYEPVKR
jgi:hypothetical protein